MKERQAQSGAIRKLYFSDEFSKFFAGLPPAVRKKYDYTMDAVETIYTVPEKLNFIRRFLAAAKANLFAFARPAYRKRLSKSYTEPIFTRCVWPSGRMPTGRCCLR